MEKNIKELTCSRCSDPTGRVKSGRVGSIHLPQHNIAGELDPMCNTREFLMTTGLGTWATKIKQNCAVGDTPCIYRTLRAKKDITQTSHIWNGHLSVYNYPTSGPSIYR